MFLQQRPGVSMRGFIGAVLIGAVAAALPALPAFAQSKQKDLTPLQEIDLAKKRDHEAIDQDYQRTVKSTSGAATVKVDPWANMRAPADSNSKK